MDQWLSLLNYSAKYQISLSTLRRRIKNNSISFKQDNGKYFIEDDGLPPPLGEDKSAAEKPAPAGPAKNRKPTEIIEPVSADISANPLKVSLADMQVPQTFVEASVFTSANRLVEELKTAYAKILQEKEEQISQLKEEIVDLRMLVRIMEQQSMAFAPTSQNISKSDDIFFGDINIKDL